MLKREGGGKETNPECAHQQNRIRNTALSKIPAAVPNQEKADTKRYEKRNDPYGFDAHLPSKMRLLQLAPQNPQVHHLPALVVHSYVLAQVCVAVSVWHPVCGLV
jgi:hypothetical protein